jgi:hypothetical protein
MERHISFPRETTRKELSITIPGDWFSKPNVLGEFYRMHRNRPIEDIRKVSFEEGLAFGHMLKEKMGIKGDDAEAMASLLKVVLKDEPTAKIISVEKRKVVLRNSGFCPLMTACLSMNLPWTWLCSSLGWPFFHGLVSSVNPKVNLTMSKRREKGDPYCEHVFEIGEGKLILP